MRVNITKKKLFLVIILFTIVIPLIIWALGIIRKNTDTHIKKFPGNPVVFKIQKNCACGTGHTLRE